MLQRTPGALALAALLQVAASGCATLSIPQPDAPPDGWTRESFDVSRSTCDSRSCRSGFRTAEGELEVEMLDHNYHPHEIPGWDESFGERAGYGVTAWVFRRTGGASEHVRVSLGTRTISEAGEGGLQLRCSLFRMHADERRFSEEDGHHVVSSERQAEGEQCRAVMASDSARVLWRFDRGIAPPRDSLAAIFDSLVAEESPLVSSDPPVTLVRVEADAGAEGTYVVTRHVDFHRFSGPVTRLEVEREGTRLALIHVNIRNAILDLAPGATSDEARVLRLLAAVSSGFGH